MKLVLSTILLLFVLFNLNAQNTNWSTSFDIGLATTSGSFTIASNKSLPGNFSAPDGFSASKLNNFSVSLGGRYMFDSNKYYTRPYGIQLKGGFTNLTLEGKLLNLNTNEVYNDLVTTYYFMHLNGVADIQDAFKVLDKDWWLDGLKLYAYLGVGIGHLKLDDRVLNSLVREKYIINGDDSFTLNIGLTPEYNISEYFSLYLDLNYSMLAKNDFTFDGNRTVQNEKIGDFDPRIFRVSFGITYYIFTN